MGWSVAPSLRALIAEANAIAPNRSKASDGTIGDPAHQARTSDHNPGARNLVHAADLTYDPQCFDAHAYGERLRRNQDRRVKYLISRGRIAGPGTSAGGWEWRPYTGTNRHDEHLHVSIWSTVAAETDTRPWWPEVVPSPDPPIAVPNLRRIDSLELDVVVNVYELAVTTDNEGRGWDRVPYPRSRIVGYTGPGIRPGVDGRYVTGEVGFADDNGGTVVTLTEWEPNTQAVIGLSVVN